MARYIDADKIVFWIRHVSSNGMLCDTDVRKVAFSDEIARMPAADVAPRAEFEALKDEADRYKRYYFRHDYDEMIAEAKAEVAREIFEELDKKIFNHIPDLHTFEIYTELKKKYTEAETEPPKGD